VDVLDGFQEESLEIYKHNPWMDYILPIHRLRDMIYYDHLFDLIDKRPLTKSELRDFCLLIFGSDNFDDVSDPITG